MMLRFSPARSRLASALCVLSLFVMGFSLPLRAQSPESGPLPKGLVAPLPSGAGGRFFWCSGVSRVEELDSYLAAGFDTLVVPLEWHTGEESADAFSGPLLLAQAGAKKKLKIIFALPAAPLDVRNTRISADSPSYSAIWTAWAQNAVASLADTPGLVGWMLPDDSRALVSYDDTGWRRYLRAHFASIEALNARWNTRFESFDSINVDDIVGLVAAPRPSPRYAPAEALPPFGSPPETSALQGETIPSKAQAGFHPAALFLADWKAGAWSDLESQWAATVRGSDAKHLVFSGACPDYAQLLAMPEGVDVSVSSVGPSVAENDIVTGNPQSLDIARRGGTRAAIARFALGGTPDLPPDALAQVLPRWMDAAIAHGSRGLAFSDFAALQKSANLQKVVAPALKRLRAGRDEPDAPVASFAVLLEPLAEGAAPQLGEMPSPRGLYGFGEGLGSGEPSNLVSSLRWGTAFGGADFLTPADLGRVDLGKYSTIWAPQLLDCSPETATQLGDWVRGGGVLVADLGLGALQNGGSPAALPPSMAQLAGGIGPFSLREAAFNVRGADSHPLFPTWEKRLADRPGMVMSAGDGRDETAFDGLTGFAPTPPNAGVLATGSSDGQTRVALTLASAGRGFFVFAPFHLWAHWRSGQSGFDGFFGDLIARGSNLAVPGQALTPFPVGTQFGATRFPEVVNRPLSLSFLNHSASGQAPQNVAVQTTGTGDWLWSNALVRLETSADAPEGAARPAPIDAPDDLEKRGRPLSLYAVVRAGERLVSRQRPIEVCNLSGAGVSARLLAENSGALLLNVWGETLQIAVPLGGRGWEPLALDGTAPFRLTVFDSPDGYRCPPGSRHRVSIQEVGVPDQSASKKPAVRTQLVVADARGRLRLEWTSGTALVRLTPDDVRR